MCRVCGRMVRCIFDTMPSRISTTRLTLPVRPKIQSQTRQLSARPSALSLESSTSVQTQVKTDSRGNQKFVSKRNSSPAPAPPAPTYNPLDPASSKRRKIEQDLPDDGCSPEDLYHPPLLLLALVKDYVIVRWIQDIYIHLHHLEVLHNYVQLPVIV